MVRLRLGMRKATWTERKMNMATETSDALVVFGLMGDLGDAKTERTTEQIRAIVHESLEHHGGIDPQALTSLLESLRYVSGDYRDPAAFARLRTALGSAARPLYYRAIPPSLFTPVIEGLAKSGCVDEARVIVERPFGRNLVSAQALNHTLHQYFTDHAIFRIDHYLGKEPVQNLILPLRQSGR